MPKKDRSWYEAMGVEDPSHDPHITEERLEKIFRDMAENTVHGQWVQRGNMITCRKCPNEHSDTIPTNLILKGTDEKGKPILQKIM